MPRIGMQDNSESVTFLVGGKLVGDRAKELERYHSALIVSLSATLFIDGEYRRPSALLFQEGALFAQPAL